MTSEHDDLIHYLDAQRASVLAIIDGLDEAALRNHVVPSSWTPIDLVAHLCGAERYWLQWVLTGTISPQGLDEDSETATVIDFYRQQSAIGNANLAVADLDAAPVGEAMPEHAELASTARTIALHLLEETARHAGHLDIARELIDGRVGLGPR